MKTDLLTARAYPLREVDLLDYYDPSSGFFFEHGDDGIVGVGAALRITVEPGPDHVARAAALVRDALASIASSRDAVPIACGAIPFDGTSKTTLVVPALSIVRRGGRAWMIEVGREGVALPETVPHAPPPEPWDTLRVSSESSPSSYVSAVGEAVARIRAGALRKVVLARTVLAESDHPFDVPSLLEALRTVEPDAYRYGVRGFLGATPELLVAVEGSTVRAQPLAGTLARSAGTAAEVLASDKDLQEHAIVVDEVRAALSRDVRLDDPEPPFALATSKLWHLATSVSGSLTSPSDALSLAALLHPTPAVCGSPRDVAMRTIAELEPSPRGLYAGTVGWVDANGDGEWAVSLRCAEIDGNRARLFAGAGIVTGSDPAAELAETDAKMLALLDALQYG